MGGRGGVLRGGRRRGVRCSNMPKTCTIEQSEPEKGHDAWPNDRTDTGGWMVGWTYSQLSTHTRTGGRAGGRANRKTSRQSYRKEKHTDKPHTSTHTHAYTGFGGGGGGFGGPGFGGPGFGGRLRLHLLAHTHPKGTHSHIRALTPMRHALNLLHRSRVGSFGRAFI